MVGTQVSESRKAHLKMTISSQVLGPVLSTKYKAGFFHPVFPDLMIWPCACWVAFGTHRTYSGTLHQTWFFMIWSCLTDPVSAPVLSPYTQYPPYHATYSRVMGASAFNPLSETPFSTWSFQGKFQLHSHLQVCPRFLILLYLSLSDPPTP